MEYPMLTVGSEVPGFVAPLVTRGAAVPVPFAEQYADRPLVLVVVDRFATERIHDQRVLADVAALQVADEVTVVALARTSPSTYQYLTEHLASPVPLYADDDGSLLTQFGMGHTGVRNRPTRLWLVIDTDGRVCHRLRTDRPLTEAGAAQTALRQAIAAVTTPAGATVTGDSTGTPAP